MFQNRKSADQHVSPMCAGWAFPSSGMFRRSAWFIHRQVFDRNQKETRSVFSSCGSEDGGVVNIYLIGARSAPLSVCIDLCVCYSCIRYRFLCRQIECVCVVSVCLGGIWNTAILFSLRARNHSRPLPDPNSPLLLLSHVFSVAFQSLFYCHIFRCNYRAVILT